VGAAVAGALACIGCSFVADGESITPECYSVQIASASLPQPNPSPQPDTRARVLDAALACFTELGYEQTTIARIRERSGVSNGALFHHFPTKEAIAGALYVDAIASFQEGLWELLRRRPRSLHAAVRGSIAHQLQWIERNQGSARFLYARGHLDWDGPAGAQLQELNRDLAQAYRDWMAPLLDSGQIRPMSMLMINAIVAGPVHAIARRWLAGQLRSPLHSYLDELAAAATAALSGTPASARRHPRSLARQGRIRLELVSDDGSVIADCEATAELVPVLPRVPPTRTRALRSGSAA
jgi:AcrR family transcriptional regulator